MQQLFLITLNFDVNNQQQFALKSSATNKKKLKTIPRRHIPKEISSSHQQEAIHSRQQHRLCKV